MIEWLDACVYRGEVGASSCLLRHGAELGVCFEAKLEGKWGIAQDVAGGSRFKECIGDLA